jgi:hypothetical protein
MHENNSLASDFTKPNNPLVGAFAWLNNPADIWLKLSAALLAGHLDEIAIIDFPTAAPRKRLFTRNDLLPNKGLLEILQPLLFWRSPAQPSWEDFMEKNP